MKNISIWKGIVLIIFLISGLSLAFYFITSPIKFVDIKDYVLSFGIWSPIILFLMIAIASTIGFIFQPPITVAALILPMTEALFVSVAGLLLGAVVSFLIARYLGRDYVESRFINKIERLKEYDRNLEKSGFFTILIFRLITVIPFELINIAGGFSKVKFKDFVLGTAIGIIPGTLVWIIFARSLTDIYSLQFVFAVLVNLGFVLLPLLSKKVRRLVFLKRQI